MPKHHVICIHGIGQHSNNWAEEDDGNGVSFKALLKELWGEYVPQGSFDDHVKIHSVHYSDEIDDIFQSWKDYSDSLKKGLTYSEALSNEVAWFTKSIDQAAAGMSDNAFAYTHLMDLILFAGSSTLQDRLVSYTASQVSKIIADRGDGDDVTLVGHSMGTAMSNKVIQYLYNVPYDDKNGTSSLPVNFKLKNVTMVANTSYALSRNRAEHYSPSSRARPSQKADEGCCTSWLNINHMLDPVGRFLPFNPAKYPAWYDPITVAARLLADIKPTRLSSKNVHAITHYFRDPLVHLPFFDLAFDIVISKEANAKAHETFIKNTPEGALKSVREQLAKLNIDDSDSFKNFYEALLYAKKQLGVLL